jgi:hypothetical protein
MSPADRKLNVFISSTSKDLTDYRAVARNAIIDAGWFPVMMENFGPKTEKTVAACEEELLKCDLVILLVAFRYGYVPAEAQGYNGEDSITALELKCAREHNKKVMIFLADEDKPWPIKWCDTDRTRIDKFRRELDQPAGWFVYEDTAGKESEILPLFRAKVYGALVDYKNKLLKDGDGPIPPEGSENFPGASRRLLSGKCIPFLGHGVYGKGPLSICALRKALGDETCQSCDADSCPKSCLATAAEFRERTMGGRDLFLDELTEVVKKQTQEAANAIPAVYDLVQQIKPPLIVSATLDLMLEHQLWNKGNQQCLIMCHAIRETDAGNILVFQGPEDNAPKSYLANAKDFPINLDAERERPFGERAYIVYKPMGSPLLSSKLGTDTVVITEEDYAILLNRLGSKDTGVPIALTTCFLNNPPIFLGYPMDVWHYRLMSQVFKSICPTGSGFTRFAVRKADFPMEKKAWEGPGINLVDMDLNEFSRKVKEAGQSIEVTR